MKNHENKFSEIEDFLSPKKINKLATNHSNKGTDHHIDNLEISSFKDNFLPFIPKFSSNNHTYSTHYRKRKVMPRKLILEPIETIDLEIENNKNFKSKSHKKEKSKEKFKCTDDIQEFVNFMDSLSEDIDNNEYNILSKLNCYSRAQTYSKKSEELLTQKKKRKKICEINDNRKLDKINKKVYKK